MHRRRFVIAAGLALAMPLPALGQQLGGAVDPEISFVRVLAALALCIAAAFALALLIAKRGLPTRFRGFTARLQRVSRLTIIESRRISPHADICLVRCDGKEYLVVCGPGDIRVMAEMEADIGDPPAVGPV